MQCPICQNEARKFGKDRHGNQRYQCTECRKTFSDLPAKPLDEMRIPMDKALDVLGLLTEGMSIRAASRRTGVAKDTNISLLVCVGQKCEDFLAERLKEIPAKDVQCDEIWGWVKMKEKMRVKNQIESEEVGDAYCYTAIERKTKLILAWHLGKRDAIDTLVFIGEVENNTRGRFQISTDGWKPYQQAIPMVFEANERNVDHAVVVKTYGKLEDDHRYSPSAVLDTKVYECCGSPDLNKACTSHVERSNKTLRMQIRRLTRLTDAHSKKWENHEAAMALFFAFYNFCRRHMTLKSTPAKSAGLTTETWSLERLLQEASRV